MNSEARNKPAAYLAFLAKFIKARGNRFTSSAAVTPGPNQLEASMMALIMVCTTFNTADLNDNPIKAISHGTRISWTLVACVLCQILKTTQFKIHFDNLQIHKLK
jgi:hypothetical protein